MYVLDTDTYSNFLRGHEQIKQRILQTPRPSLYLCAITAEEMTQGMLAAINRERGRRSAQISSAYDDFIVLIRELSLMSILRYDEESEKVFRGWPSSLTQKHPQDCRIAAVAYVNNLTIVTCNTVDFSKISKTVSGIQYEDWSADTSV